jgi:putative ABC transport system permease protein
MAARVAWRDVKSTPSRFVFAVLAVAVGVGALSGVKGFGSAFRSMLFHNAKQLTASDLSAQVYGEPTNEQLARLDQIARGVGELTRVTELVSMAGRQGAIPQMVAIKAVDPSAYPFYGRLTSSPRANLSELLTDSAILVNQELLIRLRMKTGDVLRLGGQPFRIAAIIVAEPDRLASGFGPSMRVMMSRVALDRTGLIQPGSRASQRFLFRLRDGADIERLKQDLASVLARPRITDFRDGDPAIERGISRSTMFLSFVSLIALIVGALGVGMAMYSQLQQKMDTIAIMKAIGGRSKQIFAVYLIQTLWLGLTGGVIGIAVGALVQKAFPILIRQVFNLLPAVSWDWSFSLQGLALGVLATLLFTLPPLIGVRDIRPIAVFRREMQESDRKRTWRSPDYLLCLGTILTAFVGISLWLSGSWQISLYFVGGLAVSLLLLTLCAGGLMQVMRLIVRQATRTLPATFRHGFANLYRPGTHTSSILVALGIGVMFTLSTYLIQQTIVRDVRTAAPAQAGNVFLLDIRPSQRDELQKFVRSQPGVSEPPNLTGYFVARMLKQNGRPVESLPLSRLRKDQLQTSRLSVISTLPKDYEIVSGTMWKPDTSTPLVAISENESIRFNLKRGDVLQFQAAGRIIETPVVAVYRPGNRESFRFELLFPQNAMNGIPAIYFGAVKVNTENIPHLEASLFDRFPTITVMNLAEILQRIQEAIDQVALVIRFLASFAIFAGIVILSSSIAGTRYRRIREVAILKTLGARKRKIVSIFSIEFTILGATAGLMGGVLGNVFTHLIAAKFIEASFRYQIPSIVLAAIATALLANVGGWVASMRILDHRPLEVLRAS